MLWQLRYTGRNVASARYSRGCRSMSRGFVPLAPARLVRDVSGTFLNAHHQDAYMSHRQAIGRARHVFLRGNGLPERWQGKASFTICEAGFGLARNFLALWQAWRADAQRCGRLHVLSFEAHPFSSADLTSALRDVPADMQEMARQLIEAWPPLLPGVHRLEFEAGRLTLTLFFGDIRRTARDAQACVDAFFLDGFAPANNPEMWAPSAFGQLVRIARPGASVASWCAQGAVRNGLRDAGFLVSEAPGPEASCPMTVGHLRPGLGRGVPAQAAGPVVVVGAGPSGAGMAHSLALRGRPVVVLDPALSRGRAGRHQGHLAAALSPLVSRDDDQRARLSRAGVLRALHRWQGLPLPARPQRVGTIELLQDAEQEAARRHTLETLRFPDDWASWLDAAEVSRRLGFRSERPGIFFPDGQLVRPELLLAALLDYPGVDCRAEGAVRLQRDADGWVVETESGQGFAASTVVLANAFEARSLLATCMGLDRVPKLRDGWRLAGQVSFFRPGAASLDPNAVLSSEGYWLPQADGVNVGGSTYLADAHSSEVTAEGHRDISGQVARMLGTDAGSVLKWLDESGGWAGWRAVVAGRLPVFGPVPGEQGLWLACAYGSRGLTWASLAGDLLGALLEGEPQPLERALQHAVAPR